MLPIFVCMMFTITSTHCISNLRIAIPIKISDTPNHCEDSTASFKTNTDIIVVTGSSAAPRIVAKPEPIFGIPIVKAIEGMTILNVPKPKPYFQSPSEIAPLKINVGGNTIITKVKAPAIKRTPRGNEGTSTATFPLTKMYVANVTADNRPNIIPVVSKSPADFSSKPLDKNVPASKKITEITFSLEGKVLLRLLQ